MADMDAVRAKSILEPFKHVFRAAEFLSDALETAANAERRAGELKNNIEHLEKQQTAHQRTLADAQAAFTALQTQQSQQQVVRLVALRAEAERVAKTLAEERALVAASLAEERARLKAYVEQAHATRADLAAQIAVQTRELAAKQAQIEALQSQARLMLN